MGTNFRITKKHNIFKPFLYTRVQRLTYAHAFLSTLIVIYPGFNLLCLYILQQNCREGHLIWRHFFNCLYTFLEMRLGLYYFSVCGVFLAGRCDKIDKFRRWQFCINRHSRNCEQKDQSRLLIQFTNIKLQLLSFMQSLWYYISYDL